MSRRVAPRWRAIAIGLVGLAVATGNAAESTSPTERIEAPAVDFSALKGLGSDWREENPYRNDPAAIAVGRQAFDQACQRCHGPDALGRGPAPNLRRLSGYCKRITDAEMQRACFEDNDAYFVKAVLRGRIKVGVLHMPAWQGILSQELVWALKSYVDSPVLR